MIKQFMKMSGWTNLTCDQQDFIMEYYSDKSPSRPGFTVSKNIRKNLIGQTIELIETRNNHMSLGFLAGINRSSKIHVEYGFFDNINNCAKNKIRKVRAFAKGIRLKKSYLEMSDHEFAQIIDDQISEENWVQSKKGIIEGIILSNLNILNLRETNKYMIFEKFNSINNISKYKINVSFKKVK